jgi:hypothetical protein
MVCVCFCVCKVTMKNKAGPKKGECDLELIACLRVSDR